MEGGLDRFTAFPVRRLARFPLHLAVLASFGALWSAVLGARAEIPIVHGQPLYFAEDGGASVVHGWRQGFRYDSIIEGRIEGTEAFFRASRGDQQCIVAGQRELSCRESFTSFDVAAGQAVYSFVKVTNDDRPIAFVGFGQAIFETGYPEVKHLRYRAGRALFAATRDGNQWFVVDQDQPGPAYDDIVQLEFADGKPLYVAHRNGQRFVVYDQKVHGPYEYVEQLKIEQGKPLFAARAGRHRWFLTFGDAQYGPYATTPHPRMMAAGKPLYVGRSADNRYDVVMHGAAEIERCRAVQELQFVQGKPLYVCNKLAGTFAVFGAERFGPYAGVSSLQLADGKPLFLAGYNYATALQHGRSSQAPRGLTSTHGRLFFGSGKPLYIMSRDEGRFWHVVYGNYVSPFFNGVDELSLTLEDGQPLFAAWRNQRRYVVHGQKEYGPYDGILGRIIVRDGKPLFLGIEGGKESVVFGDRKEGPYDRIWELSVEGGKLLYFARSGCQEFVVYGGTAGRRFRSVSIRVPEPAIARLNRRCQAVPAPTPARSGAVR